MQLLFYLIDCRLLQQFLLLTLHSKDSNVGGDVIKHVYEESGVKIVAITDSQSGTLLAVITASRTC